MCKRILSSYVYNLYISLVKAPVKREQNTTYSVRGWEGGGGGETRPGTEKRCSHNLQSDPLGSGFKKGRENFPQ